MSRGFWITVGIILIMTTGGVAYMKSRGLRNNNPGNIRDTGTNWDGLDTPRNDGAYLRFVDAKYGIRALAKILHNYQSLHHLNTVRGIINRWAPSVENNTGAYTRDVSDRLGVNADTVINVDASMPELVAAIIHHENGVNPYSTVTIADGIKMAGIAV